ncbi:MAG: hypothetical protein LW826_02805 [Candidatus Jidaibacter sp.]|nr:hypothetical protein [Candidatus Jidaibacter sp.]
MILFFNPIHLKQNSRCEKPSTVLHFCNTDVEILSHIDVEKIPKTYGVKFKNTVLGYGCKKWISA